MQKEIVLTIMCALINEKGELLFEYRNKKDWPGLTFPGGHVEDNEYIFDAVIREMKEETGLEVMNLENVGYIEWNDSPDNKRHLSILFIARNYKGELHSSLEGRVFFLRKEEINNYPLSNDFDKILKIIFNKL